MLLILYTTQHESVDFYPRHLARHYEIMVMCCEMRSFCKIRAYNRLFCFVAEYTFAAMCGIWYAAYVPHTTYNRTKIQGA